MRQTEFELDLDKFAALMDTTLRIVVAIVANECYRRITLKSPVLSGRFRASWTMHEDYPDESVAPKVAIKSGVPTAVLPAKNLKVDGVSLKQYPLVIINNSLPYAERIEDGWSKTKAPEGVMLVTVNELTTFFNDLLNQYGV